MEQDFWLDHWQRGHIPFHRDEVNPLLRKHYAHWAQPTLPVLVPLCGKSIDMPYLMEKGHHVIGVEWAQQAVAEFFDENQLTATFEENSHFAKYSAQNITIYAGDIFSLHHTMLPSNYLVYDRASIVAFNAEQRSAYAQFLAELLPRGTEMLMITIDYDQALRQGPPFAVGNAMIESLFSAHFAIEKLDQVPIAGKKIECYDCVYRLIRQ